MKNTGRRAFIMNECNSPYISQAIFILREGVCGEESGVLADAEKIVASYMKGGIQKPMPERKKNNGIAAWLACAGVAAVVFAVLTCAGFMLR